MKILRTTPKLNPISLHHLVMMMSYQVKKNKMVTSLRMMKRRKMVTRMKMKMMRMMIVMMMISML